MSHQFDPSRRKHMAQEPCADLKTNFDNYPVWIAHYLQPARPRIDHQWLFWQHSEKGRVNGIREPVDFNVFAGDSTTFKRLLIQ